MAFPFAKEREQFPILNEMIQLSSCSQSAMSIHVKSAINEYIHSWGREGMDWIGWMDRVNLAKASFANLINASPDEIAVFSSVSESASSIASALTFTKERNKIVTTEIDFPSIGHIWLAQQERGGGVRFIPNENNTVPLEYYEQYVDEQTLITSIPHVSYYNGFKQDLKKIASIVHQKGSYLFVDAYQSAGSVKIDVKEMDVDFLTSGSQKYLLGIPGIAFLYVKSEIANQLKPSVTGWFGRADPFDFDIKLLSYANGARRFETGTPPMVNAFAAHAAIEILLNIGVENIEKYLQNLSKNAITYAKEKGLEIASPENLEEKASNTAIFIENAQEYERKMKEQGIIVSARSDVIRIAPHFYNTEHEVIAAIDALVALKKYGK